MMALQKCLSFSQTFRVCVHWLIFLELIGHTTFVTPSSNLNIPVSSFRMSLAEKHLETHLIILKLLLFRNFWQAIPTGHLFGDHYIFRHEYSSYLLGNNDAIISLYCHSYYLVHKSHLIQQNNFFAIKNWFTARTSGLSNYLP